MSVIVVTIPGFSKKARTMLEKAGDVRVCEKKEDLMKHLADATVLVAGLEHTIDQEILSAGKHLKIIAVPATGTDHIDRKTAEERGVRILSLAGETEFLSTVTSTAELALGLIISLLRHIPRAHASVMSGHWDREAFRGHALAGKTLGIVGYGRLGKMMATFGKAVGMKVIYSDPHEKGSLSLSDVLRNADVISLHVPLNSETEGMIGKAEFSSMKPTAILINTSRGKIVKEDELIDALKNGTIAGYAADVLGDEVDFAGKAKSPLIDYAQKHDNVILTPHIGGCTEEDREKTDVFIAEKVVKAL